MDSIALLAIVAIGVLVFVLLKKARAGEQAQEEPQGGPSRISKTSFSDITARVPASILEVCQANAGKRDILEAYIQNWTDSRQITPEDGAVLMEYYQNMTIRREEIKCPVCGKQQPAQNKTCEGCGAFLGADDMVACPKCRRLQNAAHARCAVCGADMKAGKLETEEIDYTDTVEVGFIDDPKETQSPVQGPAAEKKPEQSVYTDREILSLQQLFTDLRVFARDTNLPAGYAEAYRKGMIFREGGYADCSAVVAGMTTTHRYLILSNQMRSRVYSKKCIAWKHHEAERFPLFKVLGTHSFQGKTGIILLHIPENAVQAMKKGESPREKALLAEAVQYFEDSCCKPPVLEVNEPEWLEFCRDPVGLDLEGRFLEVL